jgi:tetratricopeptide (TPR) repeat protein
VTLDDPQTSKQRTLLQALALVLITFVIYLPCLHGGKILDDDMMLNPLVQSPAGLPYIWFKSLTPDYFPLTFTSLWVEFRFFGENLFGYHITNIALHAISAVLLWRLLRALKVPGAWLAALLFAVHPVNVESVAWVSQRKNALTMPFFLATTWCYVIARTQGWRFYALSLFCFVLSLLSKTAVVPMPFVLLLCDWWLEKRITGRDINRVAPFFALSVIFGLITLWFQSHRVIGTEVVQTASWPARFAIAGCALWFYIYKAFLPLHLVFVYPRWEISATQVLSWLPSVAFVGLAVVVWRNRQRWPGALLALGYFVLMLLPVLGFVNIYYLKYSLVADHWQYFAIVGPIAFAAAVFVSIARATVVRGVSTVLIAALAFLSWKQSHLYSSAELIWHDTMERNPTCWLAYNSYGLELMQRAFRSAPPDKPLLESAIENYHESLRLNPDNVEARINTGSALIALGRVEDGKKEFRIAQQTNPKDALAFYNLGFILHQEHKLGEAEVEYRKAIKIWPQYTLAHLSLGRALHQQGKFAEAEQAFSKAASFLPVSVAPHRDLAGALEAQGKFADAAAEYRKVIELQPADAFAHYLLGNVLVKLNQLDAACDEFANALAIEPKFAEAHYQLAVQLAMRGNIQGALDHYHETLRLNPNWLAALNNAAWLLATAKDATARSGKDAIMLAERAVMLSKTNQPDFLDTLSAAYAESGRFDEAVKTANQAIHLASAAGQNVVSTNIAAHRQLYRAKQPVRE